MIISRIHGGLGNQMFQYAMGYRMAHDRKVPLRIDVSGFVNDPRPYALTGWRIEAQALAGKELDILKPKTSRLHPRLSWLIRFLPAPVAHIREKHFAFDPLILDSPVKAYFDGYWQTEKYFLPVAASIRAQFQLQTPLSDARRATADLIKEKSASSISVHVRRGDYVATAATHAYHGTCAPEWYERAMTQMAADVASPFFFVFSDDPEWARANLPQLWPTHFVDPQSDKRDFEDMHLMAQCRHNIIANSSFSWWGAWLNAAPDKRVIAPARWFNQGPSDTQDIIPPTWTKL